MTADALTTFIAARLDEDERLARAATDGPWIAFRAHARPLDSNPSDWIGVTRDLAVDYDPDVFATQKCSAADAAHIARHDPARVLRGVEVKRLILARYQRNRATRDGYSLPPQWLRMVTVESERALTDLAVEWSDHPDYAEAIR